MPRQARLDAPDALHHVMVRGLERRVIFRDDQDRADFVARLAALAKAGAWTVYAWALLPNHAHLLVRTGTRPLARSMRSLLTGYAGYFNRRHKRVGHLFQNRYKSVVMGDGHEIMRISWLGPATSPQESACPAFPDQRKGSSWNRAENRARRTVLGLSPPLAARWTQAVRCLGGQ